MTVPSDPAPEHLFEVCGLIPFMVMVVWLHSWLSLLAVLTGVLYHLHDTKWTKWIDVTCVFAITIYVNTVTAWKPTLAITLAVAAVSICNSWCHIWPVHVFLVQAPLALCLYFFETTS